MAQKPSRVYFFTGSFTHTFYKEIFRYPPANTTFLPSSLELTNDEMKKDIAQSREWYFPYLRKIEKLVLSLLTALRIPKLRYIRHPECDLIHSAQYPLLNRTPWVLDFEDVSVFTWYEHALLKNPLVKRLLEHTLASKPCRAILPWTNAARHSLENALDTSSFKEKIRVIYPVMTPQPDIEDIIREKRTAKKLKILFIGTAFYAKGGVETLVAIDELSKSYPLELVMISNVPKAYQKRYKDNPSIRFLSKIPLEVLRSHYRTGHLFLAPYHTDTFGFVLLEAFSYGIPAVGTDQFAIPEIIEDGVNGSIVQNSISRFDRRFLPTTPPVRDEAHPLITALKNPDPKYLSRLRAAIIPFLENREQSYTMGARAYATVSMGKFSPQERQKAIGEVYTRALQR